ncbi:hypothetical protein B0O99DRAFT_634473 [Bisporella sp. PMI_857]|nr:hypothetical protein B0O99DRAFT_634473 [Bisporella sp. PMI_857]
MPIFQDELSGDNRTPPPKLTTPPPLHETSVHREFLKRRLSEESIRTELCEGLLDESAETGIGSAVPMVGQSTTLYSFHGTTTRVELIERLKKTQTPAWVPNSSLDSMIQDDQQTPRKPGPNASRLLPSPEILEAGRSSALDAERLQDGQEIERPGSALHSGDFTERPRKDSTNGLHISAQAPGSFSDPQPWIATSPPRDFSPFQLDSRFPSVDQPVRAQSRGPSLSSSLSSSFIWKAPTSPLVQSESHDDLDYLSKSNAIDITSAFQRNARRHTLQNSHSDLSTSESNASYNRPIPSLRRDNTFPYQAHQPRRSLTSIMLPNQASSPQTPMFLRSRRPSISSDTSPLLHASMVGSYEESILRGRMSTTPSKPLDFVAQIGVLGLGKCKPNLRCPAHVTIPFPAVFYSYDTTTHGRSATSEDEPSPYVGQIDLENNIPNPDEARDAKRKRATGNKARAPAEDHGISDTANTHQHIERDVRRAQKQKRRSTSPRAPPGGSYRIPEKGQLQIIIKNPNKTAVKLFLVPYDLAGMEPGTKTFIRQRSYSAGPIIDGPLATNVHDRPTLRYLVHLHICSPSRGRFYLYKSIRLVFANRVPDGKEKLRNEISMPEPRFSVYKPGRDSNVGLGIASAAGASLAAEKAYRRRSSGFALGHSHRGFDAMDGIQQLPERTFSTSSAYPHSRPQNTTLVQPIPFAIHRRAIPVVEDSAQDHLIIQSPSSSKSSRPPTSQGSEMSWTGTDSLYGKLSKGEAGYGGNIFKGSPDGKQVVAESLLAKRLRGVGLSGQLDLDGSGPSTPSIL